MLARGNLLPGKRLKLGLAAFACRLPGSPQGNGRGLARFFAGQRSGLTIESCALYTTILQSLSATAFLFHISSVWILKKLGRAMLMQIPERIGPWMN